MSAELIEQHIRAVLQQEENQEKRKEALLADYEAKGYRIIDGGQTGPDTWDVTDYRTGKLIAEGDGGIDGLNKVTDEQGAMWVHVDPITDDLPLEDDPVTEGLPESLCEALTFWVSNSASDDDLDMILGESEDA